MIIRKLSGILLVFALPALLITGYGYHSYGKLSTRMDQRLTAYGFENAVTQDMTYRDGYLVYTGIALDPDKFSTISDIQIPATLQDIILQKQPKEAVINAAKLSGEFSKETGLDISGWTQTLPPQPEIDRITLKSGQLDLLTSAGALRFDAKGELTRQEDGITALRAAITAEQHQLQAKTNWSGKIHPDGRWAYEIDIQDGTANLNNIQGSRMSGWLALDKTNGPVPAVNGQIDAGKLTIGQVNLMNLRLTLSGPMTEYKLIGAGHIGGFEEMSFTIDAAARTDGLYIDASIETAQLDDLIDFLAALQAEEITAKALTSLLLTEGNLERLRADIKKRSFDRLELQIYGPAYDLAGKVIVKNFKDGDIQNNVISLDPGAIGNDG
ncbi:MAG: hypothetical protein H6867_08295 [Rhodospirillales bacterium]|nr:hypothetical protein [Rhodospirillales bacterium]MCB9995557.1 hypothetical protein [Rhodospirillales bacterium]